MLNSMCSKTEYLNLHVIKMTTGMDVLRTLKNIYHANMNVCVTVKNLSQIKSGIKIKVRVSVKIQKNILCLKKVIFGILQHVAQKMVNM